MAFLERVASVESGHWGRDYCTFTLLVITFVNVHASIEQIDKNIE